MFRLQQVGVVVGAVGIRVGAGGETFSVHGDTRESCLDEGGGLRWVWIVSCHYQ